MQCGLSGIVIRDTYSDRVLYQCVVTTDLTAEPEQFHEWIRSRWQIEETFMQVSRYGGLNEIGSCRKTVGAAIAHILTLWPIVKNDAPDSDSYQIDRTL